MRASALLPLLLLGCSPAIVDSRAPTPSTSAASASAHKRADEADALFRKGDASSALVAYREAWDAGDQTGEVAYSGACAASRAKQIDEAFVWLDRAATHRVYGPAYAVDHDLDSVRGDPRFPIVVAKARQLAEARAREMGVGAGLVRSSPEAEAIDRPALDRLLRASEDAGSSAVVVLRNGRLVGDWYFGGYTYPIEAMSATKSVVELAIGILIADGRIASLDEPVWRFYPEWRQGRKEQITLRMLLNHTSGLQAGRITDEVYRSPDFVQLALAAELTDAPGTRFFYNNKAVNLLAGVVERASGTKLDDFLRARLFLPLGVRDVTWSHDAAGNPHGMAGLQIHPLDFAKVGQLMLDAGQWNGAQILDPRFIAESTRPSQADDPTCGLLWWIAYDDERVTLPAAAEAALRDHAVPARLVDKFHDLYGKSVAPEELSRITLPLPIGDYATVFDALNAAKIQVRREATGAFGFAAEGYLGQMVLVIPSAHLVVVRMLDSANEERSKRLSQREFMQLARALVPH